MEKKGNIYRGKIAYINYDKQFATIEYADNNKQKSVNFQTKATDNDKKPHQYRLHDHVSFEVKRTDRGDKMMAYNVRFSYNDFINQMIQKAAIDNEFSGYLKVADGKFFVKELKNYILFPVQLSRWEKEPVETTYNTVIPFKLVHLDKPGAIAAELFTHNYIPEYKKAQQHFKNKAPIAAVVYKISPHAVYLELFGDRLQAKLLLSEEEKKEVKQGDTIQVIITHLSPNRMVLKKAP